MDIQYKKIDGGVVQEIFTEERVNNVDVSGVRKNLAVWEKTVQELDEKIKRAKKIIKIADGNTLR